MEFDYTSKKIFDTKDVGHFKRSLAYHNIQDAIKSIILLVKSHDVPKGMLDVAVVSPQNKNPLANTDNKRKLPPSFHSYDDVGKFSCKNAEIMVKICDELNQLITEVPPIEGPRRFGNYAFKDWFQRVKDNADKYLEQLEIKTVDKLGFIRELKYYFLGAFGSNVRLDYGTGHELSFVAVIGALLKYNLLKGVQGPEVLAIFAKYYDVVRRLILTYSLEPAGSHGVWGLDDHFHFIYILGAAQFNDTGSKMMIPSVSLCLNDSVLHEYLHSNLYVNAIAFIKKIKSGPFNEHSPILFDIHNTVHLWKKVLSGLLKMYDVEVLGKFPVVQHFWFGNVLYPWKDINFNNLPYNPVQAEVSEKPEEAEPEFLNGSGVRTTASNISMTGAPWLKNNTNVNTRLHNPRAINSSRPRNMHSPINANIQSGRKFTSPRPE